MDNQAAVSWVDAHSTILRMVLTHSHRPEHDRDKPAGLTSTQTYADAPLELAAAGCDLGVLGCGSFTVGFFASTARGDPTFSSGGASSVECEM